MSSQLKIRLLIALVMVGFSVVSYLAKTKVNPVTGKKQRVAMSFEEEIQLGLQAAPQMIRQHGGHERNQQECDHVSEVGYRLVQALNFHLQIDGLQHPYKFDFHLLEDDRTVNAFALPGGQVFITDALYDQLKTEGQLAGVLGHEIGHVLERHGAQRMAKQELTMGVVRGAGVAGGGRGSAQAAAAIGNLLNMKYGRNDEHQSDEWGVRLTTLAGYNPESMIGVMEILKKASGGKAPPEMLSTHPPSEKRIQRIKSFIKSEFPQGLPPGLVD